MNVLVSILKGLLPTTWLNWLNGYKSIIGLAGLIAYVVLPLFGVQVPNQVGELFGILFGTGMIHKAQKLSADIKQLSADFNAPDETEVKK